MEIPVIKVNQWLPEWDNVDFTESEHRRKPEKGFYIFSISAKKLKRLSAVYRRTTEDRELGTMDLGIQRQHDPKRSDEIGRFVKWGFPWSEMSGAQRESDEFKNLQKPGWLPTAIVINILTERDERNGKRVAEGDRIRLAENGNKLILGYEVADDWKPSSIPPIEVIDGQHRLWSFDDVREDFELPVVAFMGLDISWQAYLFWSINIKPKKINPSLAFDLYPLLRAQDWLEGFLGPIVYREARAQEIVELLWANEQSPWHHRINMLGERGLKAQVTQAAWIRSLLSTYIKPWKNPETIKGGFFGVMGDGTSVVPWSRTQQAAFLMLLGTRLKSAIMRNTEACWIRSFTNGELNGLGASVFESQFCMLNTDQGIRGLLDVSNSMFCVLYNELRDEYLALSEDGVGDDVNLNSYSENFERNAPTFSALIDAFSAVMAQYDWRSYEANFRQGEEDELKKIRAGFRGSGGYKLIRDDIIEHVFANCHHELVQLALSRIRA